VILFVFVRSYSPAFFDADWFHQRILVEDVLRRPHLTARVLSHDPRSPATLIVVASDSFQASSPMAGLFSLMGWRTPF
jgi:hypothetical protein